MNATDRTDPTSDTTTDSAPVAPPGPRRLTRPRDGRMIGGVCEGIGRYAGVDTILVRLVFVVAALCGLAGVVVYLAAWLLVPEEA